jgi:hypothetical protein
VLPGRHHDPTKLDVGGFYLGWEAIDGRRPARIEAVAQHQQRRCSALGSNLYPFGLVGEEFCLVGRPAGWAPSRVPSTGVRVPAEERTASMAVSGDR